MSTTRPKQHHYVPRFYLERFADPEGHVWTFDKFTDKVFATSPSKLARESGFYQAPALGTEIDQTAMESMLSELEGEVSPIIARWLEALEEYRKFGTIGGCVALALRLHVDVPQAYRTPLELAMRASLELVFPESEALYADCVRFVREALLETPRAKREAASTVLVAMWVFGVTAGGDSLIEDAELVAELAQVYQNELGAYWTFTAEQ